MLASARAALDDPDVPVGRKVSAVVGNLTEGDAATAKAEAPGSTGYPGGVTGMIDPAGMHADSQVKMPAKRDSLGAP